MDNEIIQAYLWREVIRMGFSPSSDKDKKSWLVQYNKSLKEFWQIEEYPPTPKVNGAISASLSSSTKINILIDYSISNLSKYIVNFLYIPNKQELMWSQDVDSQQYFLFPEQSLLQKYAKLSTAKSKISTQHIESVLNGLIFHPAVHQHLESPIDNHEIRIGSSIYNPFVFLFQLRYQLCPNEQKRNEEKIRLVQLFENSIRNNDTIVNANDLFKG